MGPVSWKLTSGRLKMFEAFCLSLLGEYVGMEPIYRPCISSMFYAKIEHDGCAFVL